MTAVATKTDTNKKDTAGSVLSAKDTSALKKKKVDFGKVIGEYRGEPVFENDDEKSVLKRINSKC